ncbi:MAG: ParB/RepB/Spo0J family partition protein [bacterium]|nr:ParB/RepB/Spo0J family partition protein [bacterium]
MTEINQVSTEIKDIAIASIDPESSVNVRRSEVEEGIEKVKASIAEHGFWKNNAITIRPHPDKSSEYKYEIITGQCRFKACTDLGLGEIPSIIQDIDEDEAIRRSWAENEGRTDITDGDKAYWVKKVIDKAWKEGKTAKESFKIAVKFFAMSDQKVKKYYPAGFLPREVREMVGQGKPLNMTEAEAIGKSAYRLMDLDDAEKKMKERADWIANLPDRAHKDAAVQSLKNSSELVSIDELDAKVQKEIEEQTARVKVAIVIPEALHGKLLIWGKQQGLSNADDATIISHMITKTLQNM